MSALDGGNFGAAFLSGFVSSIVSSSIEALGQTGNELTGTRLNGESFKYAELNKFGNSSYFKASMIVSGGVTCKSPRKVDKL